MPATDSPIESQQFFDNSPPPLAALFLIKFDQKVGYTISWKQSLKDVPLEGVVEFKSLPSGLHNVKEDLVYFVQDQYAGISAFINRPAGAEERNAKFIAVGAMVRLGDGRLGRAWEHAGSLKDLAGQLVVHNDNLSPLEDYWDEHKAPSDSSGESSEDPISPFTAAQRKVKAISSVSLTPSNQTLPSFHPAHTILEYLDTFGPLLFPLHRAALLRKRILFITPPPLKLTCEYVYDLAILSSLPNSLSSSLPLPSPSAARLQPLFNVGIHDIPFLSKYAPVNGSQTVQPPASEDLGLGWIACTSDEILAMKPQLYDILIELPHPDKGRLSGTAKLHEKKEEDWPILKRSDTGAVIKATQRDWRRYRTLRRALSPLTRLSSTYKSDLRQTVEEPEEDDDEQAHLLYTHDRSSANGTGDEEDSLRAGEERLVERISWSALAYSSFMWWASAGEKEEGLQQEEEQDIQLLDDLAEIARSAADSQGYHDDDEDDNTGTGESSAQNIGKAEVEMAIIGYFHRITKEIFESCVEVLDERDGEVEQNEDEDDEDVVVFGSDELRRCGLDVWSEEARNFIKEFVALWFDRAVEVHAVSLECCGVKVC
ncbi:hypothetical protein E2P81_ATG10771 [Venturia nashicola]|uniref:DUF4484 domain-containing protein n=1 Tax=Venturia nashicola TaxID=86259 RepID=A0A4Z1PA60_9PEZI|nr:hypothetical protein E6O75_ATG10442 [Venturia nashicola]TLD27483.1 hypothetical protein E2P81_ATG10771 [Venturia nashicola]